MSSNPWAGIEPVVVDERGAECPVPVIALAKAVAGGATVIDLLADDPVADIDVAAWCVMTGNTLESRTPLPSEYGSGVRYRVLVTAAGDQIKDLAE